MLTALASSRITASPWYQLSIAYPQDLPRLVCCFQCPAGMFPRSVCSYLSVTWNSAMSLIRWHLSYDQEHTGLSWKLSSCSCYSLSSPAIAPVARNAPVAAAVPLAFATAGMVAVNATGHNDSQHLTSGGVHKSGAPKWTPMYRDPCIGPPKGGSILLEISIWGLEVDFKETLVRDL